MKRWIEQRMKVAPRRTRWSALDILALEDVYIWHRLISALSKELIEEPMLHEFACRCAENFLRSIKDVALVNSYSGGYRLILVADYSV